MQNKLSIKIFLYLKYSTSDMGKSFSKYVSIIYTSNIFADINCIRYTNHIYNN